MWSSKRTPRAFFDPEARTTVVALFIQASEHLLVYLWVDQGVSQISQGHVLSNLKLILCTSSHTLCFFMLGPITHSPFKSYCSMAESLTFSSNCSPFFVVTYMRGAPGPRLRFFQSKAKWSQALKTQ